MSQAIAIRDAIQGVGLFVVSYRIGTDAPGAPTFETHLAVDTPNRRVSGLGTITQAVNPPLDVRTRLDGDFTYMTVMPRNTHILVTLTGFPVAHLAPEGGIGPVALPNARLRMVLEEDWKSGVASYEYTTDGRDWQHIADVPVRAL